MINKMKKWFLKNYIWAIFLIVLILFISVVEKAYAPQVSAIDISIHNYVVDNIRSDALTPILRYVTEFGNAVVLLIISVCLIAFVKNKRTSRLIITNLVGITVLNQLLKNIVQRPRPELHNIIKEIGYSFPSGHSMVSAAFYGLIIYFIYKNASNKKISNILITILSTLILLIGFSRIYLGVHYTSDVLAGFLIAIAYLILVIKTISKPTKKEKQIIVKTKKLVNSFKYAFSGIFLAFKTERNMKIHTGIVAFVTFSGIALHISAVEWMICVIVMGVVIAAELFNTSLEQLTDVVMPERNPKAKIVKDISAGAVLITAIAASIIGAIIFLPKLI